MTKQKFKERCLWGVSKHTGKNGGRKDYSFCKHQNECGPKCKFYTEIGPQTEGIRKEGENETATD